MPITDDDQLLAAGGLLPSKETRALLMTLCQDQGELTLGQRIDQVVEAYADMLQCKKERSDP